jgi:hypothetical protein
MNPVTGLECLKWPETKALLNRLGVRLHPDTCELEIKIPMDGEPLIVAQVRPAMSSSTEDGA